MTSLRVGDVEVAHYGWDADPPTAAISRPALHPVRTLSGTVVTAEHPADHPWHRGIGIALPDVDGTNLWGGPSYLPGSGYHQTDLGIVGPAGPPQTDSNEITDSLTWCDRNGHELLHESRWISTQHWTDGAWSLQWTSVLTGAGPRAVRLGSPGSNGRSGAGYGGFFWRLPDLDRRQVSVFTANSQGEDAVNGATAGWIALTVQGIDGGEWTAVLAATDERTAADPWFVRVRDYIGVGSALAWDRPVVLPPGLPLRIAVRMLLVDGVCDRTSVPALLAGSASELDDAKR